MRRYIALLRGINVGGNNKISMPELKAVFEEHGFTGVKTYINSGNVIFSSAVDDEAELRRICKGAIRDRFRLEIPVAVLSAEDLSAALQNAPDWWGEAAEAKHNAIFVLPPDSPQTVMEQVGAFKPEYEQVSHYGQVIFWSAPLKTISKVRWLRIVGTAAYKNVTIRNANTTKKLLALTRNDA